MDIPTTNVKRPIQGKKTISDFLRGIPHSDMRMSRLEILAQVIQGNPYLDKQIPEIKMEFKKAARYLYAAKEGFVIEALRSLAEQIRVRHNDEFGARAQIAKYHPVLMVVGCVMKQHGKMTSAHLQIFMEIGNTAYPESAYAHGLLRAFKCHARNLGVENRDWYLELSSYFETV